MTLTYRTAGGWRAVWQGFIAQRYFPSKREALVWIYQCNQKGRPQ